jgi:hypothetical protein
VIRSWCKLFLKCLLPYTYGDGRDGSSQGFPFGGWSQRGTFGVKNFEDGFGKRINVLRMTEYKGSGEGTDIPNEYMLKHATV